MRHSGVLTLERARARHAFVVLAFAFALSACSETTHTVGVSDVNAVSNTSGAGGQPPRQGGTGGMGGSGGTTPIDDGSIGLPDAAIPDAAPQCADNVVPALQKRVNLYLMIDTNFLVADGGLWDKVRRGILDYAEREEAAGTGLGLRLIDLPDDILSNVPLPLGSEACDPSWYSRATSRAVEQQQLPLNIDQITRTLGSVTSTFTTPLAPALEGAIDLAFSFKNTRPDEEQAVVLLSDAFLDLSCTSTASQLVEIAAKGRAMQVRSYMIELLNPVQILPIGGTIIPLDPVAAAGGTNRARSFNLSNDAPSALADRLLEIQRDVQVCEFALPADATWDEAWLAVDTGVGPGPLTRLAGEHECGEFGGSYVTYVDPTSDTTWVRACPTSCLAITASARPPVWIVDCDPSGP